MNSYIRQKLLDLRNHMSQELHGQAHFQSDSQGLISALRNAEERQEQGLRHIESLKLQIESHHYNIRSIDAVLDADAVQRFNADVSNLVIRRKE